jgi:hypothetical protein
MVYALLTQQVTYHELGASILTNEIGWPLNAT